MQGQFSSDIRSTTRPALWAVCATSLFSSRPASFLLEISKFRRHVYRIWCPYLAGAAQLITIFISNTWMQIASCMKAWSFAVVLLEKQASWQEIKPSLPRNHKLADVTSTRDQSFLRCLARVGYLVSDSWFWLLPEVHSIIPPRLLATCLHFLANSQTSQVYTYMHV